MWLLQGVFSVLKGGWGHREYGNKLFNIVCCGRTKGNGFELIKGFKLRGNGFKLNQPSFKLKEHAFRLGTRKQVFAMGAVKHWNRLPREGPELWIHSGSGWMGHWEMWSSSRCPAHCREGGMRWPFPTQVILWFYLKVPAFTCSEFMHIMNELSPAHLTVLPMLHLHSYHLWRCFLFAFSEV